MTTENTNIDSAVDLHKLAQDVAEIKSNQELILNLLQRTNSIATTSDFNCNSITKTREDIEIYLDYKMTTRIMTKPTANSARKALNIWANFADGKLNQSTMWEYYQHLHKNTKLSDSSIRIYMVKIRGFCEYHKIPFQDPVSEQAIKLPTAKKTTHTPITEAQYKELLDLIENKRTGATVQSKREASARWRHWVMVQTMAYTGLRVEELSNLQTQHFGNAHEDLNLDNEPTIHVRNGKGNKERYGVIPEELKTILVEYVDNNRNQCLSKSPKHKHQNTLFDMDKDVIAKTITDYGKQLGYKHISPHALRRFYATQLWKNTHDLRLVAKALGHSDTQNVERYIVDAGLEVMRDAVNKL